MLISGSPSHRSIERKHFGIVYKINYSQYLKRPSNCIYANAYAIHPNQHPNNRSPAQPSPKIAHGNVVVKQLLCTVYGVLLVRSFEQA